MKVAVIGAGLGGLTLAHGLRQAGIEVAVYERDGATGRPQGVSLHIDDRGLAALRTCLPSAHAAMAEATTGGPREQTLTLSGAGGELTVVDTRPSDGTAGRARPGRQVHRPLLRAVLLTGLDDVVRFDAEFTRFERCADGTVRLWFADGRTDTADVLVGADGIGSAVRRRYLPDAQVADTGRRMIMGATPLRAVADAGLPGLIGDSPASVRVGETMLALGVLRFTQRPAIARQRWLPALRFRAVADCEDYVMWALPVLRERLGSGSSPATLCRLAQELAADLHRSLRSIVAAAWPEVTAALRIGVIPPVPAWPAGPVTVIGDAIHPAPGFGANLAMQDARWLCEQLVEASQGRLDVVDAIGAYEETMRRNNFTAVPVEAGR